jgi:hypothetical protein
MKNTIDFFHIGYHKTASTWFQTYGYPSHPEINLLNKGDLDPIFYSSFVAPDGINFDLSKFEMDFMVNSNNESHKGSISGVCEENLTGNPWTGRNSDSLLLRISEQFKGCKVIISIRNQKTMIESLYSNYVKSGGMLSFSSLLNDLPIEGGLIKGKLEYHNLIKKYFDVFGKSNVMVYMYEDFVLEPEVVLDKIAIFLNIGRFPKTPNNRKLNQKFGYFNLNAQRGLNSIHLNGRYADAMLRRLFIFDKRFTLTIPKEFLDSWTLSNKKTSLLTDLNLSKHAYI